MVRECTVLISNFPWPEEVLKKYQLRKKVKIKINNQWVDEETKGVDVSKISVSIPVSVTEEEKLDDIISAGETVSKGENFEYEEEAGI